MDKEYRVRYTDEAVNDLDLIFGYIADHNVVAAQGLLDRIEHRIRLHRSNPYMGAPLPDNAISMVERGYRYLVVEPYVLFYRVLNQEIVVGRILHSRQDWLHLVFDFGLK